VEVLLPAAVIGDQLFWHAGDLPAENKKAAITRTAEVISDALLGQVKVTGIEISKLSPELGLFKNIS
jgi:hypothetical protein